MKKIGFLVSGNGGTLKFIHLVKKKLSIPYEIIFVIGDRQCGAIDYAKENGLENFVVQYTGHHNEALTALLKNFPEVDLIITNIHKIIDSVTLNTFEDKFINLHYSLLPAYSGLIGMETVVRAKKDNVLFLGATCHEVDESLDGGPILAQSSFSVDWNLEVSTICHRVFVSANYCLLNAILRKLRIKLGSRTVEEHENVNYNPPLIFNPNTLTGAFWKEIAK